MKFPCLGFNVAPSTRVFLRTLPALTQEEDSQAYTKVEPPNFRKLAIQFRHA